MKMWEYIDILSVEAKLYVYGKDRYKTKLGAFMSVLAIIATFILCGYFLVIFLEKREVSVIYNATNNFYPYIDMNDKPFVFSFHDANDELVDPRVATMSLQYWMYNETGRTVTIMELEKCDINVHFTGVYREIFKDVDLTNFSCFPKDKYNITMYGKSSTTGNAYFNIYFTYCTNTTEKSDCLPQEEIDTQINKANIYLNLGYPDYSIDHNNYTHPFSLHSSFYLYPLSTSFFYSHYSNFLNVFYHTDQGNVFQDIKSYDFYKFSSENYQLLIYPPGKKVSQPNSFSTVQLLLDSNKADMYNRSYPKLQSVVANMGGVIKFVLTIASVVVSYISDQYFKIDHSNAFFNFDNNSNPSRRFDEKYSNVNVIPIKITSNLNSGLGNSNFAINPNPFANIMDKSSNRELRNSRRKRSTINLSRKEIILPYMCFSRDNNTKRLLEKCNNIMKKKLSTDYLLNAYNELEKLKVLLFDHHQVNVFNKIPHFSVREHEEMENKVKQQTDDSLKEHLSFLRMHENIELNKKLLKLYEH